MSKSPIRPGKGNASNPRPNQEKKVNTPVTLSFRHLTVGDSYCLSRCEQPAVREIVDCLRQLTTLTWQQVLQTSGKGTNKAGLGYTKYADAALKQVARPSWLSQDIEVAALRASQKIRVFGFYLDHVFYLLWFDRNHEIVPV